MLANVAIPMIFVQLPLMAAALVPVVFVEALVMRRHLRLPYWQAFGPAAGANFLSTLIGIPLAWGATFALQVGLSYLVQSLGGRFDSPFYFLLTFSFLSPFWNMWWTIPAAVGLLLIPSFLVSVWSERLVIVLVWGHLDRKAVRAAVLQANIVSYIILVLLTCGWLAVEAYRAL